MNASIEAKWKIIHMDTSCSQCGHPLDGSPFRWEFYINGKFMVGITCHTKDSLTKVCAELENQGTRRGSFEERKGEIGKYIIDFFWMANNKNDISNFHLPTLEDAKKVIEDYYKNWLNF